MYPSQLTRRSGDRRKFPSRDFKNAFYLIYRAFSSLPYIFENYLEEHGMAQDHKIIPVPFTPSGSHQPSSNRLAPPERPTTSNLAPYHRVWPTTDQPWPQLGVASRTRSLQMAFSCGDGSAHRWACHLMMMMLVWQNKCESDMKTACCPWWCHPCIHVMYKVN